MSHRHEAGPLKQQNKSHKTRFRTKGQRLDRLAGRTIATAASRKKKAADSKAARKLKQTQARAAKRDAAMQAKRRIGTTNAPPYFVLLVHLQEDTQAAINLRDQLVQASVPKGVHNGGGGANADGTWVPDALDVSFFSTRLKKKMSIAVASANVLATLELTKVADTVVFVGKAYEEVAEDRQLLINCLCAQGVPTTVHVLTDLEELPQKKRSDVKRTFAKEATDLLPDTTVQFIEKPSDYQTCLWGIANKKRRTVHWREARTHVMAERVSYDAANRELRVTGYVRGPSLNVNALVYLPGLGARQMSRVLQATEPIPSSHKSKKSNQASMDATAEAGSDDATVLAAPTPEFQHTLQSEVEVDPLDAEQTFPTEEELAQADSVQHRAMTVQTRKVRVPKGFSDYQASWLIGDDDDEDDDAGDNDTSMAMDDEDEDEMNAVHKDIWEAVKGAKYVGGADGSDADSVNMERGPIADEDDDDDDLEEREYIVDPQERAKAYDATMDMTEEEKELKKLRAATEDFEFPDEIDTPADQPARVRFAKYRGLQSFRHTPWDPREDLPPQYARIFKFKNFDHTRRRAIKDLATQDSDEELQPFLVGEGTYVTVCIADVPEDYPQSVDINMPLVLWVLMEHENKMSVVHFLIKMHPTYNEPIKSKERLVFQTGTRRFYAEPIFSSNSNGNKHKFERFLQPGASAVATVIAPVVYPPMPVLCFKEMEDGSQLLVASGAVVNVNPDRIVVKRIRLSGYPFKINKRSAVIRHMFFNCDDIHWFRPVELTTKLGRRGHIKESLGTHGHMKCVFDQQLKAHDTVLLNLYKRVYPKWKYEEAKAQATDVLTLAPLAGGEEEGEPEEQEQEDNDDMME
ncbi:hypothetical protein PTSG_01250 [Salpingoeca rosetta]|uniref:Bms1-type G domain-containing protein n=1 Tax=Salpingoeca rosetta (strain ATCC 50818 / BSB-021) TaxID=946362 RepID=F2TZT2_SALR5|nr:uncharacterized protein PTSG_01250 [Salpingoeca rosetta]EGD80660.1 hypothetical protein PTSG_01250 [Salpingoeca rosetta]|eukprot:XP_004997221.1 hypothetical protein PTSG_01250 [Salpingoeca rosetta]